MRGFLIFCSGVLAAAGVAGAGDVSFSLDINNIPTTPRADPATEARLAQWNDPMGRLLYHFNQQQAWVMRGTMPGGDRAGGVAIMVKAQPGLSLQLLATTMQAGLVAAQQDLSHLRWPWIDDETLDGLPLEERLSIELGRRLVPK
jgi:hypothetical protein